MANASERQETIEAKSIVEQWEQNQKMLENLSRSDNLCGERTELMSFESGWPSIRLLELERVMEVDSIFQKLALFLQMCILHSLKCVAVHRYWLIFHILNISEQ